MEPAWMDALNPKQRSSVSHLLTVMTAMGIENAEDIIRSDLHSNTAILTAFEVLNTIDEGYDDAILDVDGAPYWALMESNEEGRLTGRQVAELHALLLRSASSGRQGRSERR